MSDHPLSRPIQFCAGIVLVIGVLSSVAIALNRGQLPERITEKVIPAALILAAAAALCGVLLALSGLLEQDKSDPSTKRLLTDIRDQLARSALPVANVVQDAPAAATSAIDTAPLARLLEEIRDIALLDAPQRRERLERLMGARRQAAATTIEALIKEGKWSEAAAALDQATSLFGDAPSLGALRTRLAETLSAAEQTEFVQLQKTVLAQQAAGKWDEAIAATDQFIRRFPHSRSGMELHTQLVQTRDANTEATANALFDEIRTDIEQRSWRRALGAAQRLLAKCPNHPKAQRIRGQLDAIRENADTEQRNAVEAHIHELVKAGRLKEAAELGDELIRSYPLSPQAEVISRLVLKIRERLDQQTPESV